MIIISKGYYEINRVSYFLTPVKHIYICLCLFPIQGIDELPDNVIQLLKLATQTPPVAKAALQYALFASGAVLLLLALGCLVRNSHRQETMSLEGTAHYSQDEKKKPKKTIPPAPMSATVLSNGNGTAAKANAGYVADDE